MAMRLQASPLLLTFVLIQIFGIDSVIQAEPRSPMLRSFRPIVPIKQNVRGGLDQMETQTLTVKIPPPPIPEEIQLGGSVALSETSTPAESELPPEVKPERLPTEAPVEPGEADQNTSEELKTEDQNSEPEETEKRAPKDGPTLEKLRAEAHALAEQKLDYIFGAEDPKSGVLDCSATIQFLLKKIGVEDVPRTSYDQYDWLKKHKLLDDVYGKSATEKLFKKLSPGDLIFWGGTWKSGHRVSNVMLYMGYDQKADKHYIFGARGSSVTGLTGSGVDIFDFDDQKGRLIAHGKIPGLIY